MLNTTHYQRNANQNYNEVPSCTSQNAAVAAAKSLQSYPALCDPIDCSPPGSSVPEILQARILEWVAISFSMLVRMAAIKSLQTINAGEGVKKREPSCTVDGDIN